MSRFYKTSTPDYVEDFMYTPPWEMMGQVMAQNEQGIQQTLASTSVFEDLDIDYIEDPVVQQQVEAIKNKYAGEADEISKTLQAQIASNPQSWRNQLPKIGNLGKELQKDFKSGQVNKIMSDKKRLATWVEENKDLQKTDPMLFNAGYQYFMNEWRSDSERSKDWEGQRLSTFDINSKEIIDAIKENEIRTQQQALGNGYMLETKGRDKNAIIRDYMVTAFSDPEAQLYLQQAIQFGVPGFVDEEGEPIPIEVYKNFETGETVDAEEYERERKLFLSTTPEERAKSGMPQEFGYGLVPNEKFAWTKNFANIAERYGGITSQKMTADATYNQAANREATRANILLRRQISIEAEGIKQEAERLEKIKKDRRDRNKEILKLEDELFELDEEFDGDKIEYIEGKIRRLKDMSVKNLSETQNEINYSHNMNLIENSEVDSKEYNQAKNLDNAVLTTVFKDLGYAEVTGGNIDEQGRLGTEYQVSQDNIFSINTGDPFSVRSEDNISSVGNVIPSVVAKNKEKQLLVDTYMEFNTSMSGTDEDTDLNLYHRNKAIKEYLVGKGVPKEKLYPKTVSTSGEDSYLMDSDAPYFKEFIKKIDEITEAKKDVYRTYASTKAPVNILPFNIDGQEEIRNNIVNNYGNYTIRKVTGSTPEENKKKKDNTSNINIDLSKLPTVEKLASDGYFQAVAVDSPYGEVVVADLDGEKYYVINNQGEESAFMQNRALLGNPDIYEYPEDFNKVIPGLTTRYLSTVTASFGELAKIIQSPRHPNSRVVDENNKNSNGENLVYSYVSIPLINGESIDIRQYHNQDTGFPYSVVPSSTGVSLEPNRNIKEVTETISSYMNYIVDKKRESNKNRNFTGYK